MPLGHIYSILFLGFWLCWVPLLWVFSGRSEQGLLSDRSVQDPPCSGFSDCGAWALGRAAFSSCGTWLSSCSFWALECSLIVVAHRPSCPTDVGSSVNQGWNPCLRHWQVTPIPEPPGGPLTLGVVCSFSHSFRWWVRLFIWACSCFWGRLASLWASFWGLLFYILQVLYGCVFIVICFKVFLRFFFDSIIDWPFGFW